MSKEALKLALDDLMAEYCMERTSFARRVDEIFKQALAAPVQPVAWKWHQAPVKTSWGPDMVVADLAIDKDNTVSVYCERDQTAKVEVMFNPPAQEFICSTGLCHYKPAAPVPSDSGLTNRYTEAQPAPVMREHVGEWVGSRSRDSDPKRIAWKPGYVVNAKVGDKIYAAPAAPIIGDEDWEAQQKALAQYAIKCATEDLSDPNNPATKVAREYYGATPPAAQRPWVGLTDEKLVKLCDEFWLYPRKLLQAIEAELKELNT